MEGILTAALRTLIEEGMITPIAAKRTTALALRDNWGSARVFKKSEFGDGADVR